MKKESKSRLGQVSIFIILLVIIVAGIAMVFVFRNNSTLSKATGSNTYSAEIGAINDMIKDCINQRAIDGIRIVGLQGGYVNLPENYLATNLTNVAYGYFMGKNILATKSTMEKEISSYVEESVPFCIETDFNNFNITKQKPVVTTKISPDFVSVLVTMPISASKESKAFTLDKTHNNVISVRLGKMIDVATKIINREIAEPNYIPLSYLDGVDYNVLVIPSDNELIYAIVDVSNNSKNDIVPYSLLFANKFGGEK
ncbi:MAG: hypothetical protein WC979_06825 [Candidatus Pacearchaeota archaeon]|jgi:hypothetical protein